LKNDLPIFDGHNDTLLNLYSPERGKKRSFFVQSDIGHLDLPRARQAGFAGGFFAIFVPETWEVEKDPPQMAPDTPLAAPINADFARWVTAEMAGSLFKLQAESQGQFKVARTAAELEACLDQGILAAVLHIEGTEALDPDLDTLYLLHAAGLRSLGITWSRPNAFGYGVPFRYPELPDIGPGLTEAGEQLVRTCNEMGILVDVSHLNEKGFWDVARLTDAPLVATHANAHTLSPSSRNLTNPQIDAIGESGGVIGLNFHVSFLREDGRRNPDTPLEVIVRHADYLVDRIGIDHVAFGSDFDGAVMPKELGDVTGLPRLLDVFRERGYDQTALRKITHENWLRVLRETWKPWNPAPMI
jgi:membrane dipeptidase